MSQTDDPGRPDALRPGPAASPTAQQPPVRPAAASSRSTAAAVRRSRSTASSRTPPGRTAQQYGQQPAYGQQPGYGAVRAAYGQYGASAVPARPPHVITAAVLGFIFGALGVLVSLVADHRRRVRHRRRRGARRGDPGLGRGRPAPSAER